jgi:predicted phage terminase large subunit-like protein
MLNSVVRVEEGAAKKVLAGRELARRHLIDFQMYVAPWYRPARHHRLVGEYLEQVETFVRSQGKTGVGRLLIMMPPRHGKSEQASIQFPAWLLGRNPDSRVIVASYGLDLASDFSKKTRDIVRSDRFRGVFGDLAGGKELDLPVQLSEDSRSVQNWDLAAPHRGGVTAAGVGGGITGKGAHLLVLDDPVKNREEAESQGQRDKVWEWWTSTARTRLENGAAVVISMTHWHADDLAGRILRKMASEPDGERWVVLSLPAVWEDSEAPVGTTFDVYQHEQMLEGCWVEQKDLIGRKVGEALWPDKYDVNDMAMIEKDVEPYNWAALFQQRPYLRSGAFFKREWFTIVDTFADPAMVVTRGRFWDKAGTKSGSGGDFAAGVRMAITKDDVVYVEHLYFEQVTPMQREEAILRLAKLDAQVAGPRCEIWHQQDPGSAGLDSAQATNMWLAKNSFSAHFNTVTGDKEVRAGPWSSACEAGRVRLMRGAWNAGFIERHVGFPKARYDDDVDAASWGFGKLNRKQTRKSARSYQG